MEETSSIYIAIMLMIFVLFSKLVENAFRCSKRWLYQNRDTSLVAVLELIKDEVMLVGTLSMVMLIAESWFSSWCVAEEREFVPVLSQEYCRELYTSRNASLTAHATNSSGRRMSATAVASRTLFSRRLLGVGAKKECPEGQTFFMDQNAIHQVDFLVFWLAVTHIIYSVCVVLLSRYWARELVNWEEQILSSGKNFVGKVTSGVKMHAPSNRFEEYVDAFMLQFTHFTIKGMDTFTAGTLRQFYIISQKKDTNYRFFHIVKEELERDFQEICGIDSILWLFTAFSLFLEGQGSNSFISKIPMAGTLFVMVLSLVIGTNLMLIIQRLLLAIHSRMLAHGYTWPVSLSSKKAATKDETTSHATTFTPTEQMFEKPTPIKADMGLYGYGKSVWLWGIKFCMFEFSRKITYIIFYYQQFRNEDGFGQSCYHLSRAANGGLTVYLSLICCVMFCAYLGLKVIPLYSLSIHLAMRQRKLSYMQKLATGVQNIHAVHQLTDNIHHGNGRSIADQLSEPTSHAVTIAKSKYVVPPSTSKTDVQPEHAHTHEKHLVESSEEESFEEESSEYNADDVLPDTMCG